MRKYDITDSPNSIAGRAKPLFQRMGRISFGELRRQFSAIIEDPTTSASENTRNKWRTVLRTIKGKAQLMNGIKNMYLRAAGLGADKVAEKPRVMTRLRRKKRDRYIKAKPNQFAPMKIIFTQEDRKTARKGIDGFRQSYIIDTREIILEVDYIEDGTINTPQDFITNKEIEKKLTQAINNKKSTQVIYFHYKINAQMVKNIKKFFRDNGAKFEFVLFDPSGQLRTVHRMFDGVLA